MHARAPHAGHLPRTPAPVTQDTCHIRPRLSRYAPTCTLASVASRSVMRVRSCHITPCHRYPRLSRSTPSFIPDSHAALPCTPASVTLRLIMHIRAYHAASRDAHSYILNPFLPCKLVTVMPHPAMQTRNYYAPSCHANSRISRPILPCKVTHVTSHPAMHTFASHATSGIASSHITPCSAMHTLACHAGALSCTPPTPAISSNTSFSPLPQISLSICLSPPGVRTYPISLILLVCLGSISCSLLFILPTPLLLYLTLLPSSTCTLLITLLPSLPLPLPLHFSTTAPLHYQPLRHANPCMSPSPPHPNR